MNKAESHRIVRETFENSFDKERFIYFVKNLLNSFDDAPFVYRGNFIPDAYEKHISAFERIGKYTDGEFKIDILIVHLKKENSIERARSMQRNFIAWYLNGSRGNELKDAALVAFVAPNNSDWRFSLVKMDYKFEEGENGKIKVKEEFTPARRWSFLVGANENSHTAQSWLAPIVEDDNNNPTLKQLEYAFNIEKVTKEFFDKYRDLFLRTKDALDELVKNDEKLKKDFQEKSVNTADFSKKLLGQIVFLYFLQKKGWFGVEQGKSWGTGSKSFMRDLFEKKVISYNNFFNDVLEHLFYDALARDRSDIDHFNPHFNCKIPFLNGGLFDPINGYSWEKTEINIPNDLFSNTRINSKTGDKGDGVLDIFDRYNFTVKEDEPLEKEVAIDPEMLGKVFENLLEVKDRKSKGTYYTPREIVHYMCEQSLVNYLATELNDKVSKEDIEKLIKYGETVSENEARVEVKGKETNSYNYKLPESIRKYAIEIDEKLVSVKVCDPAIGSGAFPVGMMNEIVKTRSALNSYLLEPTVNQFRTVYNFKRDCIQNSLYGVDLDPGAVEIAKLRLWLSLVVDEDDIKQIKPLPNLDYKIMQGNSLLEEFEGIKLFDEKLITTIDTGKEKQTEAIKMRQAVLQKEYFELHSENKLTSVKQTELETELKKLKIQLKKLGQSDKTTAGNAGLFDVYSEAKKKADALKRLHKEFFEVTQKSKKDSIKKQIEQLEWDLIEATLKEQNKTSALKKLKEFKQSNIKPFFLWKLNFAEVFQEKGGFDIVIANPPYVTTKYGKISDVQKKIYLKNFETAYDKIDLYVLFFEKAIKISKIQGLITFISPWNFVSNFYSFKIRKFLLDNVRIRIFNKLPPNIFDGIIVDNIISLFQKDSNNSGNIILFDDLFDSSKQILVSQDKYKNNDKYIFDFPKGDTADFILEKMQRDSELLGKMALNYIGIMTGGQKEMISDKPIFNNSKPVLSGKDIFKWFYIDRGNYVNFDKKKIHSNDNEKVYLSNKKILLRKTGKKFIACLDANKFFTIQSLYNIVIKDNSMQEEYLLALLNSKLFTYIYNQFFITNPEVFPYVKRRNLDQFPIKKISPDKQKSFIKLVDKILKITQSGDYLENPAKKEEVKKYEEQIDQLVYKLYDLTPEEIEIVENSGGVIF